jgi:imidazolonepropionase-like amidohydrolase
MTIRVTGVSLPNDEAIDLTVADGKWVEEYSLGLDTDVRIEGWVLPGLVDVHTHPGATKPGEPLNEKLLREELVRNVDQGVIAIRSPGLAGNPPDWFGKDPQLPYAVHAGPWLAKPGQFITGWGKRVSDQDFPRVAAAQAAASGWCKITADWGIDDEAVSPEVMVAIVEAVRAVGGRVAVHSQTEAGSFAAVTAGVDSLEHGMWLSEDLLDEMAIKGVVLTPTLRVFEESVDRFRAKEPSAKRSWYVDGTDRHPGLVRAAIAAGVTVLAGTDSAQLTIGDEIRALASAGLTPTQAIATGSWSARSFLGLSNLTPGTSADATVYSIDPRTDLRVLEHPEWVISRGRILRRPQG